MSLRGGTALLEHLQRLAERATSATTVSVGFPEDETYPDGTPVALVAATQEFGAPARNIPPRPFFRTMVADKSPGWGDELAKQLAENGGDAKAALEHMGELIAQQLRESIESVTEPPLAPATVRRKGSDQPLIDTERMLDSVTWEIDP